MPKINLKFVFIARYRRPQITHITRLISPRPTAYLQDIVGLHVVDFGHVAVVSPITGKALSFSLGTKGLNPDCFFFIFL
jgi:uncharacterized protein YybS (DUF2232 family)